jgi:hypothetical protein
MFCRRKTVRSWTAYCEEFNGRKPGQRCRKCRRVYLKNVTVSSSRLEDEDSVGQNSQNSILREFIGKRQGSAAEKYEEFIRGKSQ